MNNLYAQFQTDPEIEKNGIELAYVIGDGKAIIFKIARAGGGNTRYQKVLDVKTKPYRRQIQTEMIAPEQLDTIMREVYSESVMLGWWTATEYGTENEKRVNTVEDAQGNPMEFNAKNIIKLFTALPDLFSDVQIQAQKVSLFRKQQIEADAKNS